MFTQFSLARAHRYTLWPFIYKYCPGTSDRLHPVDVVRGLCMCRTVPGCAQLWHRWVFTSHGVFHCYCVTADRMCGACQRASSRWKAGEGAEVAECCSGNRLSSQEPPQVFTPLAFSIPTAASERHLTARRGQVPGLRAQTSVTPRFRLRAHTCAFVCQDLLTCRTFCHPRPGVSVSHDTDMRVVWFVCWELDTADMLPNKGARQGFQKGQPRIFYHWIY